MEKNRILFVCLGNICRSPMAEFVMKDLARKSGAEEKFFISSAATSDEAVGCGIHSGTCKKLREKGIPFEQHFAVQITAADYDRYDCIIGMEKANIRDMLKIFGGDPDGKVYRLLDIAGESLDVADPWYTGDFDKTYDDILLGCKAILKLNKA